MPAISTLTLNDGQATPVAHSFAPKSVTGNIATYVDRSATAAIGFNVVTISVTSPAKGSKNYRVRIKVVAPVLEVVNASTYSGISPAPTKAYDLIFDCEFVIPERSTLLDRQNILAYARNILVQVGVGTIVTNLENVW